MNKPKAKILTKTQREVNFRFIQAMYEILGGQKTRGISEFCQKTGIKTQTISYCKKNERSFSMGDILKLHKYYKYSPNWILLGIEPKKL